MCSLILWGNMKEKKQAWSVFFPSIYIFKMLILFFFFWFSHLFMSMSKLCFLLSCNWLMCIVNTITNNISSSTENKPKRDSLLELKVPYCNHVNLILFANNKYDLYILFKTPVNQFWCLRSRFRAMFAASRKKRLNLILILYFFNICFVNDCQLTVN